MGRYYDGDIEGKFWFGVQESTEPERFGCRQRKDFVFYVATEEDIPTVEKGIADCVKNLKKYGITKKFLNDYLKADFLKTVEEACRENGIQLPEDEQEKNFIFHEMADYELGKKILKRLKKKGYCEFRAEL